MKLNKRVLALVLTLCLSSTVTHAAPDKAEVRGHVVSVRGQAVAGATVVLKNPASDFVQSTVTIADGSFSFLAVPFANGYEVAVVRDDKSSVPAASSAVDIHTAQVQVPAMRVADEPVPADAEPGPPQSPDTVHEFHPYAQVADAENRSGQDTQVHVVTYSGSNAFHGRVFGNFMADSLNADSPLSVYNRTSFDYAAQYAGVPRPSGFSGFAPLNYNDYVNSAINHGYCTDSISATPFPGSVACATSGFGANHYFDPAAILASHDSRTIPLDFKQFGAYMGGPLVRDKLFLFGSYEGTLLDNPTPIFERVPSTFDRTYNPLLTRGVGVPYGFSSTNPDFVLGQRILGLYPVPNVIGVADALEFYQGKASNWTNTNSFLDRLDWTISENSSLSLRYNADLLSQLHDNTLPASPVYAGNGALRTGLGQDLNVSFVHLFSPTLLNSLSAGFDRLRLDEAAQDEAFDATALGLPHAALPTFLLSGLDQQYSGGTRGTNGAYGGWIDQFWSAWLGGGPQGPMLPTLDGHFPMARLGAPLTVPSQHIDTSVYVNDTLSWTHSRHTLKLGGEYRHLNNHFFDGAFSRGIVVSSDIGEFTSDSEVCNFNCGTSFLAPSFDYALAQNSPYNTTFTSHVLGLFAQDTWQIHPRVTLTFGLRWEYFGVPQEQHNLVWNFDTAANGLVQQNNTAVVNPFGTVCTGVPEQPDPVDSAPEGGVWNAGWDCLPRGSGLIVRSDWTDFAPRLGFAWDVFGSGKTVLRAGVGWFYAPVPTSSLAPLVYNRPTPKSLDNPQLIYGQTIGLLCEQCGMGNTTLNPAVIVAKGYQYYQSAASPFGILATDVNHSATPYTRQITVSVQQQLTGKVTLEVGYMGLTGSRLPAIYNAGFNNEWFCTESNPGELCDSQAGFPVFTMSNRGQSTYHSLNAHLTVARWHGLQVNVGYTWSHGMDNTAGTFFPLVPGTFFNLAGNVFPGSTGNPAVYCYIYGTTGPYCPGPAATSTMMNIPFVYTGGSAAWYQMPQDPYNFLNNDWGGSNFNAAHRVVMEYTWDVPPLSKTFGLPRWLDNWQLSGELVGQSGQPFTVFSGPVAGEFVQRVNELGSVTATDNPSSAISSSDLQLPSVACEAAGGLPLVMPPTGGLFGHVAGKPCTGNSGRNAFIGPAYINSNLAIQKRFLVFGEKWLSFRATFFNLFDRANYYNPVSNLSLDGVTVNPDFGHIKAAHAPRQIQLGIQFTW